MILNRVTLVMVGMLLMPVAGRAAEPGAGQSGAAPHTAPSTGPEGPSVSLDTPEVPVRQAPVSSLADATGFDSPSPDLRMFLHGLGDDFKHLPSRDTALVASVGGALALAVHPLDDDLNHKLARDGGFFRAGDVAGNTLTLMGASTATYALGRAFGDGHVARVGLDLLRAQILSEVMVESLKVGIERPRPDGSSGYSFPSGHAALTFATAAVLDRHQSWRIAVPAYAFASYVATSRLHDNVHNLSDVVFGAAVGTIAGRTVTRRLVPHFDVVPQATRGGMAVMFVRTTKAS